MSIEDKIAASLNMTTEELKTQQIAASIGMTLDELRAKQQEVAAVAALSPGELEAARRFGMSPESYAHYRTAQGRMAPEEMRAKQVALLRQSADGILTDANRAKILRAADELEASPIDQDGGM